MLESEDNPEKEGLMQKWGVATFLLPYSSIAFILCISVCGGQGRGRSRGVKFSLFHFGLQSFELTMQDSRPSLYSIKTL